ncbi:hypothetical protein [Rhizobium leguminosarum]|uniref:hypothetical protein n=1 Tax=Rhizobium leguminosarum TaxID=384 RepID=UPI00103F8C3F|nr:hypothetical protein [Rhizobium leguminosarum]TBZ20991.1 hypothetical protein E0H33_00345 [Rhizobium leguminosarum bv. viciae]
MSAGNFSGPTTIVLTRAMAKILAASFSGAIGISIDEVLVKKETRDIDSRIAKIETARENLLEAISAIDEIKATAEENKRELAELQKSVTKIGKQKEELTQDRKLLVQLTGAEKDRLRRMLGAPTRFQSIATTVVSFIVGGVASWLLTYAYDFGIKEWIHGLLVSVGLAT